MHKVLDLDLDFFVWPPAHWPQWEGRMPTESLDHIASADAVREFLEDRCGLDRRRRLPGRQVVEHHDAFVTWRDWIDAGLIDVPFEVVHVDAHADLGLGDSGYIYLLSDLLALPVDDRRNPAIGSDAMNSGNYLAFAILGGQVKTDNLWTGKTDNSRAAETGEFYFVPSS